ncbi:izumo sperm-egg fusion protein 1 [Chanos chanos]|uniref:Izumo sperm-egg fusion protein 1 n=1 Tax=Chanos chanos TaxID=29144 RepID=A0A6J2UNE1_CHACN|nr:izumo sperm-egg fusion protein 1 [Chanos chanos]
MCPVCSLCIIFLLFVFPRAESCLQCTRVVRYLHEDFLAGVSDITVQDQIELKKIIDHAYITYRDTSRQYHGVIDPTTLYRARTEYQSEFRRHWTEETTGSIHWDMITIVEKGKRILEKHLKVFVAEGLCPNKCGLLYQSVMNCSSCEHGLRTCLSTTSPRDCGEHHLEAEEGDQVVLDCFLPWHTLVMGQPDYHYSWRPLTQNLSIEGDYKVLVVTPESKIVLNQLRVEEQGVYRCLLQDSEGTTLSRTHFILTVNPLPLTTPRQILIQPTLPHWFDSRPVKLHRDFLIILLALLTTLCFMACLALIVGFR